MIKQNTFILTLVVLLTTIAIPSALANNKAFQDDGEKTARFDVKKDGKLDMKVDYGNVTIIPWDKNEVYIRAIDFDEEELEYLKIKGDKDLVKVRFDVKGDFEGGDGEFEVNVPTEFNVGISTGGGNVKIEGDIRGEVSSSSGGGNITIKNVVKGNLDLSTGGGDIRAGSVGGDADMSTGGGNISLNDVDGNIKASTGGGNIKLGKVNGKVHISTGGGNVSVDGSGGDVGLSTGGGNIEVNFASGKVRVSTGGGNVDLKDITGIISASTGGGNITAELKPSGTGDSKMSTGGGDIMLYISENAKVTIDAVIQIPNRWSKNIKKYKIKSDFEADSYEENEEDEEIQATYKLNGGGENISLRTSNSNIHIKKLKK